MISTLRATVALVLICLASDAYAQADSVEVVGWSHPGAIKTYDGDGNPLGMTTNPPPPISGIRRWNSDFGAVELSPNRWVSRADVKFRLCGEVSKGDSPGPIADRGAASSSAASSGNHCPAPR